MINSVEVGSTALPGMRRAEERDIAFARPAPSGSFLFVAASGKGSQPAPEGSRKKLFCRSLGYPPPLYPLLSSVAPDFLEMVKSDQIIFLTNNYF